MSGLVTLLPFRVSLKVGLRNRFRFGLKLCMKLRQFLSLGLGNGCRLCVHSKYNTSVIRVKKQTKIKPRNLLFYVKSKLNQPALSFTVK